MGRGLRRWFPIFLLGTAPIVEARADDVLLLRDGSRRLGKVHCSGNRCFSAAHGMPRELTEWIALVGIGEVELVGDTYGSLFPAAPAQSTDRAPR